MVVMAKQTMYKTQQASKLAMLRYSGGGSSSTPSTFSRRSRTMATMIVFMSYDKLQACKHILILLCVVSQDLGFEHECFATAALRGA